MSDVVIGVKHSKENYSWFEEGRKQGAIEQKEKDKIIFVRVEKVKNKERVKIVFADETIQFFDL